MKIQIPCPFCLHPNPVSVFINEDGHSYYPIVSCCNPDPHHGRFCLYSEKGTLGKFSDVTLEHIKEAVRKRVKDLMRYADM